MAHEMRFDPSAAETRTVVAELLNSGDASLLGAGETFLCFGAGSTALLLPRVASSDAGDKLLVAAACTRAARAAGVRTPEVFDVRTDPFPYALVERVDAAPLSDDVEERSSLYESVGQQLASLHQAATTGAGAVQPARAAVRGLHDAWRDHCEDFVARYLADEAIDPATRELRAIADLDARHWNSLAAMVREHGRNTKVVLCHYDNRLPNLPVANNGDVWLLDWDLARIAPLSHELIKVFERPPAVATRDARALLTGYGLPPQRHDDVISDALIAMSMDAVWLTSQWVDMPAAHPAIRGWLSSVKDIVETDARVRW